MSQTQTAATQEARPASTPRLVVWVELPQPTDPEGVADASRGFHDPSALYEDCERWDGMA